MGKKHTMIRAAIGAVVLVLAFGVIGAAPDDQLEFGQVGLLKNYPEFKRGPDPYAGSGGALQESVDPYSGKLTITFPLPAIPWSETKSFGPVLFYNSNVWGYIHAAGVWDVGGEILAKNLRLETESPEPDNPPIRRRIADFWTNDNWERFSPIGRTHSMPGWTLPIGGVYTEYRQRSYGTWTCADEVTNHYLKIGEKIFVAPDGSSHPMLDFETAGRPFYGHPDPAPGEDNYLACQTSQIGGYIYFIWLPNRWNHPEATVRYWHAIDGSGYYLESKLVGNKFLDTRVWGRDGTCYDLEQNETNQGMITRITDPDGNGIAISFPKVEGAAERTLTFTNDAGVSLRVVFTVNELSNWPANISILKLDRVEAPKLGGGVLTYRFEDQNLIDHLNAQSGGWSGTTITFGDLFNNPVLPQGGIDPEVDFNDRMFCAKEWAGNENFNYQVFVLRRILLPDGRAFSFDYNLAGKVSRVNYPDGGHRRYEYGNTIDPSVPSVPAGDEFPMDIWFCNRARPGQAPLGAVSLVYQQGEGSEQVERAYAYSGFYTDPTVADGSFVQSLVWHNGSGCQLHLCYDKQYQELGVYTDFGLPVWTAGRKRQQRDYDTIPLTVDAAFRQNFLRVDAQGAPWIDCSVYGNSGYYDLRDNVLAGAKLLRQEALEWSNYDAGWRWALPVGWQPCSLSLCLPGPPDQSAMADYFPPDFFSPPSSELIPSWNPIVTRKTETACEGDPGSAVVKVTEYTYADLTGPCGVEPRALLVRETESAGGLSRVKDYTYLNYWPATPSSDLPGRVLGLPATATVGDGNQALAQTQYVYNPPNPAGFTSRQQFHPVEKRDWAGGSHWAVTKFAYAPFGSARVRPDYVQLCNGGGAAPVSTTRFGFDPASGLLRSVRGCPGASATAGLYMLVEYDGATGLLLRRTDSNGDLDGDQAIDSGDSFIRFSYDSFDRLAGVSLKGPDGEKALTALCYSAASSPFAVTTTAYLDDAKTKTTRVENDRLSRPAYAWSQLGVEGGALKCAFTKKEYDLAGRVTAEYYPGFKLIAGDNWSDKSPADPRMTQCSYDGLGRVVLNIKPAADGAGTCTASTAFATAGTQLLTTVTDEAGRWRRLHRDGFGRTVQVDEEQPQPAGTQAYWTTAYTYDLLDHLTGVDKQTAAGATGQVRVFGYDPLGRLLSAQLPEYGGAVMSYTYDDLGNVLTKALGAFSETMTYDAFGRLTDRVVNLEGRQTHYTFAYDAYSGGLPAGFTPGGYTVGRPVYDGVTHPDGTVVERWFAYEWRGLLQQKAERFGGASGEVFSTDYQIYDRAGNLLAMRYPSGQVATWAYSDGGLLAGVGFDGQALASNIVYAAHGAPTTAVLGDFTTGQTAWAQAFNARLWPEKVMVGPGVTPATLVDDTNVLLGLGYPTYGNNGNITGANRYYRAASGATLNTMTNTYVYDNLNRLSYYKFIAGVTTGEYDYSMDEFGNLLEQIKQSGSEQSPQGHANPVDRNTNRLNNVNYDPLGNQTQVTGTVGSSTLVYLDQGHVYEVKDSGNTLQYRYYYDAEGKRRAKAKATGGVVSLADNCSFFFYSGEDLICQKDLGTQVQPNDAYAAKFLLTDHLSSTRAEMTFDSNKQPAIDSGKNYDFMPYGEEINPAPVTTEQIKFSGKPRDNESGLDYSDWRYYGQSYFRWMSPDKTMIDVKFSEPQAWNRYSYVGNNPVLFNDKNGLWKDYGTFIVSWGSEQQLVKAYTNLIPFSPMVEKCINGNINGYTNSGSAFDAKTFSGDEHLTMTLDCFLALGAAFKATTLFGKAVGIVGDYKEIADTYSAVTDLAEMQEMPERARNDFLIFLYIRGYYKDDTILSFHGNYWMLHILGDEKKKAEIRNTLVRITRYFDEKEYKIWRMPKDYRKYVDNGLTAYQEWLNMKGEAANYEKN